MRILSILLLVLPLAFPEACAEGVRHGLTLAGSTAIPALFPFFVAGGLLSEAGTAAPAWAAKLLRRLYGLPPESLPAVFLGLTGGYPVGAAVSATVVLVPAGVLASPRSRLCRRLLKSALSCILWWATRSITKSMVWAPSKSCRAWAGSIWL